jgi:hypothetical protein
MYLHSVWFDKHEEVMVSALGFPEIHQNTWTLLFAAYVQNLLSAGKRRKFDYSSSITNSRLLSSQSPTNALDISCSPYKTYKYVKYIKI